MLLFEIQPGVIEKYAAGGSRVLRVYANELLCAGLAEGLNEAFQQFIVYVFYKSDGSVYHIWNNICQLPCACNAFLGPVNALVAERAGGCWRSTEG